MRSGRTAALLLSAATLLAGCASHRPLLEGAGGTLELTDTPFFPQDRYQCGPAALATVLGATGVSITPEELVPQVYLPARRGSLTTEMQAAPRRYGRVSYSPGTELADIRAQLDAGRPVLVLHNYGLPFWPRWHYAVVVGYDTARQRLILRSGKRQRQQLSAATFMRAWDNADRWALVLLRPGELPAAAEAPAYLEAAAGFERLATPASARLVYEAAVSQWPTEPLGWIGRGTAHYRAGELREAARDYGRALELDPGSSGARNNLAMTLLDLGCPRAARQHIEQVDPDALRGALREAVLDTRRQIDAHPAGSDAPTCSLP